MSKRGETSDLNSRTHSKTRRHAERAAEEPLPEQEALVADLKALEAELERMATERESYHEQLLRTMADMQNYKRRVEQERQQIRLRATEELLRDLLPILDSFERSIQSADSGASPASIIEGMKVVDRQLRAVLASRKLERIRSVGEHFDPAKHDAILVDPESDQPEGSILEEFEAGFMLGDQVLRPARVKVAKGLS